MTSTADTADTAAPTQDPTAPSRRTTRVRRLGLAAVGAPVLVAAAALVVSTQDGFFGLLGGVLQAAFLLPVLLIGLLLVGLTRHTSATVRKYSAMAAFASTSLHIVALLTYAAASPGSVIATAAVTTSTLVAALLIWAVTGRSENASEQAPLPRPAGPGVSQVPMAATAALTTTAAVFGVVSLGAGFLAADIVSAADPESWAFFFYLFYFVPVVAALTFISAVARLVLTASPSLRAVRATMIVAVLAWLLLTAVNVWWMLCVPVAAAIVVLAVAGMLSLAWVARGAVRDRGARADSAKGSQTIIG